MSAELTNHMLPRRFWFGVVGSVASWVTLGFADIAITFLACTRQENFGAAAPHPSVTAAFAVATILLFAVTAVAGMTSYRNWRRISSQPSMLDTMAVEHHEFLALLGVIISITLGVGILWLALPPLFLDLCWRAK